MEGIFTQMAIFENGGMLILPPFATIRNMTKPLTSVVDTTQRYDLGTKYKVGIRTYFYCYANGTVNPEVGCYHSKKTNTCAVAPTQATAAAQALAYPGEILAAGAVGSEYVSVTIDTTIGIQANGKLYKDEMKGGYIVIGNGSAQHPQRRMIVSHPALTSTGGTLTMKVDEPLITVVTAATTTIEFMDSPFYCLKADYAGGDYVTHLGVSDCIAADTNYFWMQTRGPAWVTSNSNTCNSAGDRTLVWVGNGSVVSSDDITVESGISIAGFALDKSGSGESNAPMIYLTGMD